MRVRVWAGTAARAEELADQLCALGHDVVGEDGDAEVVVADGLAGHEVSGVAAGCRGTRLIAGLRDIPGGVGEALRAGATDVYPARDWHAMATRLAMLEAGPGTGAALAERVPDAIYVIGLDGVFQWVNPAAERLTGYPARELVGMHAEHLVRDPADREVMSSHLRAKRRGEEEASVFEVSITRADGERVPVEVSSRVVRRPDGTVVVEGIARDLRPRRAVERRVLLEAEHFAHLGVAAAALDASGVVVSWNAEAERLFGVSAAEAVGKLVDERLAGPGERERLILEFHRVLQGERRSGVFQLRRADGSMFAAQVTAAPVAGDGGRPAGVVLVVSDVGAEAERRAREALLAAVVDSSEDAITTYDLTGTITGWNGAAERVYGLRAEEVLGRKLWELAPDDQRAVREALFRRVLGGERDGPRLVERTGPDGRGQVLSFVAFPVRDEAGRVVGVAAVAREVTEQAAAERERLRLAAIVESAGDAVVGRDLEGRITSWNQAAERLFGYTAEEMVGGLGLETVPEWRREAYLARLRDIAAGLRAGGGRPGEGEVAEVERMDRWGRVLLVRATTFGVFDEEGRPIGAASFIRDISDERRMVEALRASEALLRGIFESTRDHLWLLDPDGRVVACNRAAQAFARANFGRVPEPGVPMAEFAQEPARELLRAAIRRGLAGKSASAELAFRGPDGSETWFNVQLTAVLGADGKPTGVLVAARDMTGEMRQREALRAARERLAEEYAKLATILENSDEGVLLLDRDLRLVAFNSTFVEGTRARRGLTPEPGMPFDAVVSPESAPALREKLREALQGRRVTFEVQSQTPGRQQWFEVRIRPVLAEGGEVTGLVYTARDVTVERTLAMEREAALAEANRLAAIVASSSEAMLSVDSAGRVTSWNGGCEQLYGWTAGEALGMPFTAIVPPEEQDGAAEKFMRVMSGETLRGEMVRVRKDGSRLLVDSSLFPLRDGRGEVVGAGCTSRDVTAQRAAELAALQQAADLEATFSGVREGIALVSREGRLLAFNGAADALVQSVGMAALQVGADVFSWVPARHREAFGRDLARALAGESSWGEEVIEGGGETRWWRISFAPVRLASGELRGVVLVIDDVTERKRTEERLLQAQKAESLAVLAGGIAHDFNNLLVGILGNAGLALAELPPESPVRGTVEEIQAAGQRAADLARQMLAYSGRGKFVVQPLNLNGLVEEMVHLLRASMGKGVQLALDLAPGLPAVRGDATQLRQVLMNLVLNASDAIGGGEGTVRVGTRVEAGSATLLAGAVVAPVVPAGRYVVLEVEDTGVGMDHETLGRIFDPFFTTKFTGRGLGLAAVLGIVRGHEGAIAVTSEPGRGTRFRVMLPAVEDPAASPEARSAGDGWRGSGAVLVADDEATVRGVTARALRLLGFEVVEAADGQEAVERFRESPGRFAVVLLDMTMPRLNGAEALRVIRELDPAAKVVLMSGYTEQDAAAQAGAGGFSGFLQKPYELDTLRRVVRGVLEGAE